LAVVENQTQTLGEVAGQTLGDLERVFTQRLSTLKNELVQELGKAATAGTSLGSGVGLAALGTILGGIGFVHLLQKASGLPLWLCYAASSAVACSAAAGLVTAGVKKAGEMDLIPDGRTIRRAVVPNDS
jgi:hypothetical protein